MASCDVLLPVSFLKLNENVLNAVSKKAGFETVRQFTHEDRNREDFKIK